MDIFCIDVLKRQKEDKKMQRMAHFKKSRNILRKFDSLLQNHIEIFRFQAASNSGVCRGLLGIPTSAVPWQRHLPSTNTQKAKIFLVILGT